MLQEERGVSFQEVENDQTTSSENAGIFNNL